MGCTLSLKDQRKKKEKALIEKNALTGYTSKDSMMAQDNEIMGFHLISILDDKKKVVRRYQLKPKAGLNEFVWNFTQANGFSINTKSNSGTNDGLPVFPGNYFAQLSYFDGNSVTELTAPEGFEVKSLGLATLPVSDQKAMESFVSEIKEFALVVNGASDHVDFLKEKHQVLKAAVLGISIAELWILKTLTEIEKQIQKISLDLNGNEALEKRQFEVLPGIKNRLNKVVFGLFGHSSDPSGSQKQNIAFTKKLFLETYNSIKSVDSSLKEVQMSLGKTPYIQGYLPEWDGK